MLLTDRQADAVELLVREGGAGILTTAKTDLYDVPFIHWRTARALTERGLLTEPERDSAGELWVRLTSEPESVTSQDQAGGA